MLHALIFAAVTLVVLGWSKDLGAEKTVPLRLEGAVIDGLRFFYLPVGAFPDLFRGRNRYANGREMERILGLIKKAEIIFHYVLLRYSWRCRGTWLFVGLRIAS